MKKEEMILEKEVMDMFDQLQVDRRIGGKIVHVLVDLLDETKKPMNLLSYKAVEFFKGKTEDKYTPILLSIYCLLFSRILLDSNIGVVTMTEDKKKGDDSNEKERVKDTSR